MKILLINGIWFAKEYVIVGGKNIGYDIYEEGKYDVNNNLEPIASYDDFESCLVWVWNS